MILETTFLIDLLKNNKEAISRMKQLINSEEIIGIATPTIFELWSGITTLDRPENEKSKIISLVSKLIIYQLDRESAELAGKINGELIKKGLKIEPQDLMIAGISIKNNQSVLTRDEHFSRIERLKVEVY